MRRFRMILTVLAGLIFLTFSFTACDEDTVEPEDTATDEEALREIIEEDELLASFDANYDEGGSLDYSNAKILTPIWPVKAGHRMKLTSRNVNINMTGDSAFVTITKYFDGIFLIAASTDSIVVRDSSAVDTLIAKEFQATITRNVTFKKINNTNMPRKNWMMSSVSLPEGGTSSPNIQITKLTIFLPNGDTVVVDDPLAYFLERQFRQQGKNIPTIGPGEEIRLRVEVQSAYAEDDFVTLTYGSTVSTMQRAKKIFQLVSSEYDGTYYNKVYEQGWNVNQTPGHRHAIINALPKQVTHDDAAPVEEYSLGVPYLVQ